MPESIVLVLVVAGIAAVIGVGLGIVLIAPRISRSLDRAETDDEEPPVTDQPDPPNATDAPIESLSFDDALAALQRTVAELEAGGQPLERSIALYERGVALHERCAKLLAEAELKVQQLVTRAGGALEAIDVSPDTARDTE